MREDSTETADAAEDGTEAGTSAEDAAGPTCPQCGAELYERHCKYVCPQHGVIMDCSDTFYFS